VLAPPEVVYLGAGLLFPIAAVLLVVAVFVARRRRRDDAARSGDRAPSGNAVASTTPRVVGGDRVAVLAAPNESLASIVAAALAGAGVEATVRSTGAAGYGAREFSVLVPLEERDRAVEVLRDLETDAG
jgi:hypothetical protein